MSASHATMNKEEVSPQIKLLALACSIKDTSLACGYLERLVTSSNLSKEDIISYVEFFDENNRAAISVSLEDYYKVLDPETHEQFLRKRYDRICVDKPLKAINILQQIKAMTKVSPAKFRLDILKQYKWFLSSFAGNKKIKNRIQAELDKEILALGKADGDFEHLLNMKYMLFIPFKLDTQSLEQAITSQFNEATVSIKKCSELMDVLVFDVDSSLMADIQKQQIDRLEKDLQKLEEKSAIAAKNLVIVYDKMLTNKNSFNGIKDQDRPEYLKRNAIALIKLNLQHDLDVSPKEIVELKTQIETVIYSPKLKEVITALLIETKHKHLQKSLINHLEAVLLARESKSLAAATNLIHFYAQCLFTKNAAVSPVGSAKLNMQKKWMELLCQVYLHEGASDTLRKQYKTYLKLLTQNDPQIAPQANFTLNFLRGIKKPSKNVPQNLLVCAKALITMPSLAKEKVQSLYDWENKLTPNGKMFKYGLFDDKKSIDQQYCDLAKWYLEEIDNARASSNPEAYLLQASVNGQPSYINDHVKAGLKSLGMSTKEIDHLQHLSLAIKAQKSAEKVNLMESKQVLSVR